MSSSVTRSSESSRRNSAEVGPRSVFAMTECAFEHDLRARTVLSLANGVTGVLEAATLGIHAIGRGLAAAQGLNRKHATKQVDRLLSNGKLNLWVCVLDPVCHWSADRARDRDGLDRVRRR
jgi:hypothetical protein